MLIIVAMMSLSLRLLGLIPAIVFTVAFFGGFVLWLATTFRRPIDPHKIIVPYLVTVIFFIVHVYEEYLTESMTWRKSGTNEDFDLI